MVSTAIAISGDDETPTTTHPVETLGSDDDRDDRRDDDRDDRDDRDDDGDDLDDDDALALSAKVNAADAVYKGDLAYSVGGSATSSLASAMTASTTSMQVANGSSFPSTNGFRVKVDYEIVRVTAGAGGNSWTVTRGIDGTAAVAHSAGVPRVDVNACGTAPCTTLVPTTTVTGADGRQYRVDLYASWSEVRNSSGATGRSVKLITIVVRDQASPYKVWARVASTFDQSTG